MNSCLHWPGDFETLFLTPSRFLLSLFFCLVILLLSLPAHFHPLSSEHSLWPLLSSRLLISAFLCAGSQGNALAGGSVPLSLYACLSLLSSLSSTISYAFLFLSSTLSPCCTYSSVPLMLTSIPISLQLLCSEHLNSYRHLTCSSKEQE